MKEPFPHDQTQLRHHKDPDEHLEGFCHLQELWRREAFSFPHNELYHMKNNQPNHLFGRNFIVKLFLLYRNEEKFQDL